MGWEGGGVVGWKEDGHTEYEKNSFIKTLLEGTLLKQRQKQMLKQYAGQGWQGQICLHEKNAIILFIYNIIYMRLVYGNSNQIHFLLTGYNYPTSIQLVFFHLNNHFPSEMILEALLDGHQVKKRIPSGFPCHHGRLAKCEVSCPGCLKGPRWDISGAIGRWGCWNLELISYSQSRYVFIKDPLSCSIMEKCRSHWPHSPGFCFLLYSEELIHFHVIPGSKWFRDYKI